MDDDLLVAGLAALGQRTRLAIYRLVAAAGEQGLQTGTIAQAIGVPPNYISTHLQSLVAARLLTKVVRGRTTTYMVDKAISDAFATAISGLLPTSES